MNKIKHFLLLLVVITALTACKSEEKQDASVESVKLAKELQSFRQYMGRVPQMNLEATSIYDEVIKIIENHYLYDYNKEALYQAAVDGMLNHEQPLEASDKELVEAGMANVLRQLDNYSAFYNNAAFYALNESTSGEFGGLGIEIKSHPLGLEVISAFKDTPADHAGIRPRDLIIDVNKHNLANMNLNTIVQLLRGPDGSTVDLHIKRLRPNIENIETDKVTIDVTEENNKDYETFWLTLTRKIIEVPSIEAKLLEDVGYGYIRLTHFNDHSGDELMQAMEELNQLENGVKAWIVDVRNNPGGVLSQALVVSDAFLKGGQIVSTHAKSDQRSYKADGKDLSQGMPVVILINEGSASASEIFAGALKDLNRAVLVGNRTFGKGVVQTLFPLENGSGIKLTTSEYKTPDGHSVSGGIRPDYVSNDDPNTPEDEVIESAIATIHKQLATNQ